MSDERAERSRHLSSRVIRRGRYASDVRPDAVERVERERCDIPIIPKARLRQFGHPR